MLQELTSTSTGIPTISNTAYLIKTTCKPLTIQARYY